MNLKSLAILPSRKPKSLASLKCSIVCIAHYEEVRQEEVGQYVIKVKFAREISGGMLWNV